MVVLLTEWNFISRHSKGGRLKENQKFVEIISYSIIFPSCDEVYQPSLFLNELNPMTIDSICELCETSEIKKPLPSKLNIIGFVTSVSPLVNIEASGSFFFVELSSHSNLESNRLCTWFLFQTNLYWHSLFCLDQQFLITNVEKGILFPQQPSKRKIWCATSQTKVFNLSYQNQISPLLQINPNLQIDKSTSFIPSTSEKLISYRGTITGILSDSILELDNRFPLILTHFPYSLKLRSLRIGSTLFLDNIHAVFLNNQFQVFFT